jgi:hypothetical protein
MIFQGLIIGFFIEKGTAIKIHKPWNFHPNRPRSDSYKYDYRTKMWDILKKVKNRPYSICVSAKIGLQRSCRVASYLKKLCILRFGSSEILYFIPFSVYNPTNFQEPGKLTSQFWNSLTIFTLLERHTHFFRFVAENTQNPACKPIIKTKNITFLDFLVSCTEIKHMAQHLASKSPGIWCNLWKKILWSHLHNFYVDPWRLICPLPDLFFYCYMRQRWVSHILPCAHVSTYADA